MSYYINISNNNNFLFFHRFINHIYSLLDISHEFINDIFNSNLIIKSIYDLDDNDEKKLLKNKTLISCLKNKIYLMDYKLLQDFKYTLYSFSIEFNNKYYDKNKLKSYLDNYKYNKNCGTDYWIVKNNNFTKDIKTFIFTTKQLYDLDNNTDFNNEIIKLPSTTTYIIQKYLEHPVIFNKKKYDIRAYIFLLTKYKNNIITYKFYLYNEIIVRIASIDYDITSNDINSLFTDLEDENKFNLKDLVDNDIFNKIYNNIYYRIKRFIKSDKFINKLKSINNYPYIYDIFGIDILLDQDYNSYIIDINTSPSFTTHLLNNKRQSTTIESYNLIVNMFECIFFRLIKVYNKELLNDNNKNKYNEMKKKYDFNKYFKLITKIK